MSQINKPVAPLVPGGVDPEVLDAKADLVNGEVPSEQLPSYVDDVLEFDSVDNFPEEGETGKIYVDLATNYTYRWSGSAYIQISGGSEIEINNFSTPRDIVGFMKIWDENYQFESHEYAPLLYVYIDTTKNPSIYVREQQVEEIKSYFDGQLPDRVFCGIFCTIDRIEYPAFYGYVDIIEQEVLNIYIDPDRPFCNGLVYDANEEIYVANELYFTLPYVVADLGAHIEESTGEPVEVDPISDLWIPGANKFVKFASDLITSEKLDEIGRSYAGDDGQNLTSKHYYIIRSIKTYSGYTDDEHLIDSYTPEEYENEFNFPVPTFLTNNQSVLFPVENGHRDYSCWAHLIDSDINVSLPRPESITEEDPPRYTFIQPMIQTDEPSQLIDIILEFDAQE